MKKTVGFLCLVSLILSFSALSQAQPQFKFSRPVQVVAKGEIYPHNPGISWNSDVFGIVFNDYVYGIPKTSGAWFMLVGNDGRIVKNPIKLNSEKIGHGPKVAWTGSNFGILYLTGKYKNNFYDVSYKLALFDAYGKRLNTYDIPGKAYSIYESENSALLWTGKKFAIFVKVKLPDSNTYYTTLYYADSDGKPGAVVNEFDFEGKYSFENFDIIWDGRNFIYFHALSNEESEPVADVKLYVINEKGNITLEQSAANLPDVTDVTRVSVIASKRKNVYLLAMDGKIPETAISPAADDDTKSYDIYFASVKKKKNGFKGFSLKNITGQLPKNCREPQLLLGGKKYYLALIAIAQSFDQMAHVF